MPNAHKCPKCKKFIIGDYCFICKIDVRDYLNLFKMMGDTIFQTGIFRRRK